MKVTKFTRDALAFRRDRRDMPKSGWELVGERGGMLWELHRGYRRAERILDVRIAEGGKELWVKIGKVHG